MYTYINETFFSAPLNIAIILLWLLILYYFRKTNIVRKLSGKQAAIISIIFILICSLIIGLTPQLSPIQAKEQQGIGALLGIYNFTQTWIMAAAIMLMISNLWLIILKRPLLKNIGFHLNHTGLLIILIAGFFGSADIEKLRMKIEEKESNTAYSASGSPITIPYKVSLKNFEIDHYPNGTPMHYAAHINIANKQENKQLNIEINHPASYKGYDIYLISHGEEYCIIELQKQPWKYLIAVGILMVLGGAFILFFRRKEV